MISTVGQVLNFLIRRIHKNMSAIITSMFHMSQATLYSTKISIIYVHLCINNAF